MKSRMAQWSIILLLLLIVLYIVYQYFFAHYVTLENIRQHCGILCDFAARYYIASVLVYIIIYAALVASSLPVVAPLTILGGFLFGTFWAIVYATIAATMGAIISFLLFRSASKVAIPEKYEAQLAKFSKGLEEYGAFYLLIIHFMFVVPFFVINALAAFAKVSLWRFIWTTAVGFLPCAIVYAFAGKQLMVIRSAGDIFSWKIIVALMLLIGVMLLPILLKKRKALLQK